MTTPTTAEQQEPEVISRCRQERKSHIEIAGGDEALARKRVGMGFAISPFDVLDAYDTLAAAIARLEGERDAEAERITLSVCAALGIDPNLADADGSDPVAWIVSAVQQHYEGQRTRADAAERRVDDLTPLARLGEWALERIRGVYAGDVDAFDVQDKATQFGVIAPQTAPKPCGECCVCAEMDADVCYRDTDTTTRARAFLAAASGAKEGR